MKKEELTQLPKETLSSLLDICRRNWRSVDGRWFLAVEDSCGLERATEIDCDVWSQLGKVTAGRLQKAFSLGEGIPALAKALELDPGFLYYEYIALSLHFSLSHIRLCPSQRVTARYKVQR